MNVLFLGASDSPLVGFLRGLGETVTCTHERIDASTPGLSGHEFLISYGYRHILRRDVLGLFPDRAINLHISYLPWNRGADPNLWSFIEGTPKGVTIHHLDEGIDTGDIIAQERVEFSGDETLSSSYARLHEELQQLFRQHWREIRDGKAARQSQSGESSMHRVRDRKRVEHLLAKGWETPVRELVEYGKRLDAGEPK